MKKIDGYWVDENNNRWNCDRYTEKECNPFRYYKKIRTPACYQCRWYMQGDQCTQPKCIDRINRLECKNYDSADIEIVRGTRLCKFEEKANKMWWQKTTTGEDKK